MKPPTKRQIQESEEERIKMLLKATEKKEANPIDEIDVDKEFVNENYLKNDPNTIEAHGIDSALDAMTLEDYDKHPEKRMRQAWNDYFEKQLPLFKVAYPNLKRSQYIQMIQKEFKTAPENPIFVSQMQKAKKAQQEEESEK